MRTLLWALTGVEIVTAVVVDLVIPPAFRILHVLWEVAVLAVFLGVCAMTARTPHLVDGRTLLIRTGPFGELAVPMASVASLRAAHSAIGGRGLRRVPDDDEAVACSVSSATTLVLELADELPVDLRKGGPVSARRIHFSADSPVAAVRLISRAAADAKHLP
ncbi:hypothetical protein ACZ90_13275 [Streptomyces albus subsp. albus]|nr:hypothetical protein ACZ90_13275 [Streptomyces albus subsp. albus]